MRCSSVGSDDGSSRRPTLVRTAVSGVRSSWAIVDSRSVRSCSSSYSATPASPARPASSVRVPSVVGTYRRCSPSRRLTRTRPSAARSSSRALASPGSGSTPAARSRWSSSGGVAEGGTSSIAARRSGSRDARSGTPAGSAADGAMRPRIATRHDPNRSGRAAAAVPAGARERPREHGARRIHLAFTYVDGLRSLHGSTLLLPATVHGAPDDHRDPRRPRSRRRLPPPPARARSPPPRRSTTLPPRTSTSSPACARCSGSPSASSS